MVLLWWLIVSKIHKLYLKQFTITHCNMNLYQIYDATQKANHPARALDRKQQLRQELSVTFESTLRRWDVILRKPKHRSRKILMLYTQNLLGKYTHPINDSKRECKNMELVSRLNKGNWSKYWLLQLTLQGNLETRRGRSGATLGWKIYETNSTVVLLNFSVSQQAKW